MRAVCLAVYILLTGPALLHAQGINPATGARPGHSPGEGVSWPLSPHASHIGPSHIGPGGARSPIAPTLPEPAVDWDATAEAYLAAAHRALRAGRTGEAQEAMERAQTRLLSRATPLYETDRASDAPAVLHINAALRALASRDRAGALAALERIGTTPDISPPDATPIAMLPATDRSPPSAEPEPDGEDDISPRQYLLMARAALAAGRPGHAREVMERAQTRLLDRATPLFQTDQPSEAPAVQHINDALRALAAGDRAGALRGIDAAFQVAH